MKNLFYSILMGIIFITLTSADGCNSPENNTAINEQAHTEANQSKLNQVQPAPNITWSLERDNLIKRFKLQNDRSVMFYMYVLNYGVAQPIGYYQVNKVSSVNSQLTNPAQIVNDPYGLASQGVGGAVLPSPAEDGSYGTNGDAVFGFTPEDVYIEHNMQYVVSSVPLNFPNVVKLVDISVKDAEQLKTLMGKLDGE